jgi:DNA-binding CsgD family transcriptional regulator
MNQVEILRIFFGATAGLILVTIVFLWRNKASRSTYLLEFLICTFWLLVFSCCELASLREPEILFFSHLSYIAIAFLPVFWFLFSLQYAFGRPKGLGWLVACLSLFPISTSVLAFLDARLHLIWGSNKIEQFGNARINVVLAYGPWFWLHVVYSYFLFALGAFFILRETIWHFSLYRRQAILVLSGIGLPIALNIAYVFRLVPSQARDYSPISFALTGISFVIAISRYGLLEVRPPPSEHLGDYLDVGILVVDCKERVLYCNSSAASTLRRGCDELVGLYLRELLPSLPLSIAALASRRPESSTVSWLSGSVPIELSAKIIEEDSIKPGDRYLVAIKAAASKHRAPRNDSSCLSSRELQIARLLLEGMSQKAIAEKLFVSENTVKTHIRHIYRKAGISTRRELGEFMARMSVESRQVR